MASFYAPLSPSVGNGPYIYHFYFLCFWIFIKDSWCLKITRLLILSLNIFELQPLKKKKILNKLNLKKVGTRKPSGLLKPVKLSPELADIVGKEEMPRGQVINIAFSLTFSIPRYLILDQMNWNSPPYSPSSPLLTPLPSSFNPYPGFRIRIFFLRIRIRILGVSGGGGWG